MSMPRKQQRAMIMQCFRLMMSSGVLRTPAVDPEQLTRSWLSPQPQTTPAPAPHPSVSPWLRRTVGEESILRRVRELQLRNSATYYCNFGRR